MAYGYRLNVEDVFFRMADREYQKALTAMAPIRDSSVVDDGYESFIVPTSDAAVASCALAIVGWAVATESFVNHIWNSFVAPRIPTRTLREKLIRSLSAPDKILEIITVGQDPQSHREGEAPPKPGWLKDIAELMDLRNHFVHFKGGMHYQGFGYVPPVVRDLNRARLDRLRTSLAAGLRFLSTVTPENQFRVSFLDGEYQITEVAE
jgi:hypothetical protein